MDGGLIKADKDEQMDMMMMTEVCSPFSPHIASESLTSSNNFSYGNTLPSFIDPMQPAFINPTPTLPFLENPIQDSALPSPFTGASSSASPSPSPLSSKRSSVAAMREMIFRIAAMQPIHIDPESIKPPKRRNVKISTDPQSVAARHRRERISERIRILQRLVPGGTKMDTASMLDEAIHYVKFLKTQVQSLERSAANRNTGFGLNSNINYPLIPKTYQSSEVFSHAQLLS